MDRPEERFARTLYANLIERISDSNKTVEIEGAGVHWHVTLSSQKRKSTIHCFYYQTIIRVGPEYCIDFNPQSPPSQGRTESLEEAVEAAIIWVNGASYQKLCEEFAFVDFQKRGILQLYQNLLQEKIFETEMLEVKSSSFHSHALNCTIRDRRIEIRYRSNNILPDVFLFWDETQIHEGECLEYLQIRDLAEHWTVRWLPPSQMQKRFSFLQTADVAQYYEQGESIIGEFILSWERVERYYSTYWRAKGGEQILELIHKIRAARFDRELRAGTSLHTLILSRSRRHGLRPDQPRLVLDFIESGEMRVEKSFGDSSVSLMPIDFSSDFRALLTQLSAYLVD